MAAVLEVGARMSDYMPPSDADAPPEPGRNNITSRTGRHADAGRVPPKDLGAERSLLGACMLRADAIQAADDAGLTAADFYNPKHGTIYDAIIDLHRDGKPADVITVANQLGPDQLEQVGDKPYLIQLAAGTPAISNAPRYAAIVAELAHQRALIHLGAEIIELGYTPTDDPDALDEAVRGRIDRIVNNNDGARASALFRTWTPRELIEADTGFEWLAEGMYVAPTYGMTVGEMKTAKSTVSAITTMSIASGLAVFGHFTVADPKPVVIFVGEGGRIAHTRLLKRIADSMGIGRDWLDLPIYPHYDIAPINSPRFQRTLRRDLEKYEPGLVIVDPYYTFHGGGADARNLHEEADVLNALSAPCVEAGAVLDIVNHFNRADGKGLKRITMAGGGEWVDTWRMLSHREPADVQQGLLKLRFEVGSRQWGGSEWDLALCLGRFQPEVGMHDGPITWSLRHPDKAKDTDTDSILAAVKNFPGQYSKDELAALAGKAERGRAAVERLVAAGDIKPHTTTRPDASGRQRKVWVFSPALEDRKAA
jgi:hypothetical protein